MSVGKRLSKLVWARGYQNECGQEAIKVSMSKRLSK